ncbi:14637_t:CDS:2 [Racocetra fulgida]|uniref:14637_t:CDS:1 n=1 Tax=Racocetra fulgida TaxID=60492 RepID=A0A9N8ZN17_9GLOM|nr:14637_t:CDS:2 [Racocetra fulgida]
MALISLAKVNLNDNITPYMQLLSDNGDKYTLSINAVYLGTAEEAQRAVKELVKISKPAYMKFEERSWWEAISENATLQTIFPVFNREPFKSTSYDVAPPGLSREGLKFLRNFLNNIECHTKALFDVYADGACNATKLESTFKSEMISLITELDLYLTFEISYTT